MATTPPSLTFSERIERIIEIARSTHAPDSGELSAADVHDLLVNLAEAVEGLAGLTGVLADLTGERTATERVQAVEAAHAKERFARLALAAVAEEFPCTFPKAWSGHDNINDAIEPDDVPDEFVAKLIERVERQQARRRNGA